MDSVLACCAGGPGSIPTVGKSNTAIQMVFSLGIRWLVEKLEPGMIKLRDLASPCSIKKKYY